MMVWLAPVVLAIIRAAAQDSTRFPVPVHDSATALVHVNVLSMEDTNQILTDQTVVVRASRIVALGPAVAVAVPTGARRIDGRGKYLIPGLADMHAHLGVRDWNFWGVDESAGPRIAETRSAVGTDLFLYAANGVTTLRNVTYLAGHPDSLVLEARARTAAGRLLGPQIYTSGPWRTDPQRSVEQSLAAYQAAGYDFIKLHDESFEEIDSIAQVARRLGLPILGHVPLSKPTSDALAHAIAVGYASIEHLTGYPGGINLEVVDSADMAKLPAMIAATVRAQVWNCPTQAMFEIWDEGKGPASWPERQFAADFRGGTSTYAAATYNDSVGIAAWKLRHRIIKALQDSGGGLLLGTDAPFLVVGFSVHRELQALVRAGLTPYQALATGTRNVAMYFGELHDRGTIAVGKRADLVLLTGNPLENIEHTMNPAGVMLNGRWLSRMAIDEGLAKIAVEVRARDAAEKAANP